LGKKTLRYSKPARYCRRVQLRMGNEDFTGYFVKKIAAD
jgi:hypothetical protein